MSDHKPQLVADEPPQVSFYEEWEWNVLNGQEDVLIVIQLVCVCVCVPNERMLGMDSFKGIPLITYPLGKRPSIVYSICSDGDDFLRYEVIPYFALKMGQLQIT